jgi:predicted transcriptional regulator
MRTTKPVVNDPLVIQPEDLRAWRMSVGASQTDVAKLAKSSQDRISLIETRVAGTIRTYIAVNRALRTLESQRQQRAAQLAHAA